MHVPFFRISFPLLFLGWGIKRRQFFWSRFSKHVKRGNFVRSSYHLVQFLCFGFFSPIFARIGYHVKVKFWSRREKFFHEHIPVNI